MKEFIVNFNIKRGNKSYLFLSKKLTHDTLSEFILNYYGEMRLGRSMPKELDLLLHTYNKEDEDLIKAEIEAL